MAKVDRLSLAKELQGYQEQTGLDDTQLATALGVDQADLYLLKTGNDVPGKILDQVRHYMETGHEPVKG